MKGGRSDWRAGACAAANLPPAAPRAALWIDGSLRNQAIAPDPEALASLISGTITKLIAGQTRL